MVKNIESHLMIFEGIWHFEEKPLRVAIGVDVIL
jgi:hypothetical protein